jgi:hypothetical protein
MNTTKADVQRDVEITARRLYDAEVALHIAHQSRVDAWVSAAADRLHEAVEAHKYALAQAATGRVSGGWVDVFRPLPAECAA